MIELIPAGIGYRIFPPDIGALQAKRDIAGLIHLLRHPDFSMQWRAAEALGTLGPEAVDHLLHALTEPDLVVKLGAIEALAEIRDRRATKPLTILLKYDESNEVRWACAIALREIGDPDAIGPLREILMCSDKYVRHGCAVALKHLGWQPQTPEDRTWNLIALQDWDQIGRNGNGIAGPLIQIVSDPDPDVRSHAIEILGRMHCTIPQATCGSILRDGNAAIRWKAVLTAKRCRVPDPYLPWAISKRQRNRKNPEAAALLNFLFLGLGYNYLGKWWGFLVFQIYMTTLVMFTLWPVNVIETVVFLIFLRIPGIPVPIPISIIFAIHAWDLARKMPDL